MGLLWDDANTLNEKMILTNIEKSLSNLQRIAFTYFGRAQVANIFILSKLWHIATVTLLSKTFTKKLETMVFSYIWKTMEKLQRTVVYNIYTAGGLGVFHIPSRIAALTVKHIANYISVTRLLTYGRREGRSAIRKKVKYFLQGNSCQS